MQKPKLSKSQYIKGLQCPKALWFYRHRKDLKEPIDSATQARFDTGAEIGELAKKYFGKGAEVTDTYWETDQAIQSTKRFISEGHEIIFEATASHPINGGYSRIDVLRKVPNSDEWDLIEVKSSTSVKDYHLDDMAFQYHVFFAAGYKIRKCLMMIINNKYIRQGAINPQELFKFEDISNEVFSKQSNTEYWAGQLGYVLDHKKEPDIPIGERCFNPFECEYRHHCWKHIPKYSVFNVYQKKKTGEIINQIGSYDIKDIPLGLFPNGVKTVDISSYQRNKKHVEKDNISEFLNRLEYPLYFLDYETINSTLPMFDGTRPFQQVPFQFSLHIQQELNGKLKHVEFIHHEPSDPRETFTQKLTEVCGEKGSIIVYNKRFEMARNRELAEAFPLYADKLFAINERIIDLMEPFIKRWIYDPKQQGSASIKYVLPAFTDLKYDGLEIANGQEAMDRYLDFVKGKLRKNDTEKLMQNLLEYCKLDTYAMVELLYVLYQETP